MRAANARAMRRVRNTSLIDECAPLPSSHPGRRRRRLRPRASRQARSSGQTRSWSASPIRIAAALERACSRYGVANRRADPLRLIDEIAADAIIVATPAASHVEIGVARARPGSLRAAGKARRAVSDGRRPAARRGARFRRLRAARPCAALFERSSAAGRDRPLGPDRKSHLCEFAPLPGRQSRDPLSRRRPCPDDPDP